MSIDASEIKHLPNVIRTLWCRHYPGYFYCKELFDDSEYGGTGKLEMVCCYSDHNGQYMGDAKMAVRLSKMGIREIQLAHPDGAPASNCCSIGFNSEEGKWYGWSHRAICAFGIGDKLFDEEEYAEFDDDELPFVQGGKTKIETLEQAKQAAINFARYVS